jgi:hypothetical protein
VIDPVTQARLAMIGSSGCQDTWEFADKVLTHVEHLGEELQRTGLLSNHEEGGLKQALNNMWMPFDELRRLPIPEEQKRNFVFMLAMLIDDMLTIGSVAVMAGKEELVSKWGGDGGHVGTATRRKQQKQWQDKVLAVAAELLEKNGRPTQDDLATKLRERWQSSWPRLPHRLHFESPERRKASETDSVKGVHWVH